MSSENKDNDKIKELKQEIEILDRWITVGAENGLFYDKPQKCNPKESNKCESTAPIPSDFREAQDMLKTVFNELYCKEGKIDIGLCETHLSKVNLFYNNRLEQKGDWWKFVNVYSGHIIIYLGFLIVSFAYLLWTDTYSKIELDSNQKVLFNAALVGFLGGLTKSASDLLNAVRLRVYRRANDINYCLGPFMGTVFGFIGVLIIMSGLNIETTPNQAQTAKSNEPLGLYVIAFASALFWERIVDKLKNIIGEKMGIKETEGIIKKQE